MERENPVRHTRISEVTVDTQGAAEMAEGRRVLGTSAKGSEGSKFPTRLRVIYGEGADLQMMVTTEPG